MIFQHFNLLNSSTVYKNIAMPLILSGVDKAEIKQKVEEMLAFVNLSDKMYQYPDELSGPLSINGIAIFLYTVLEFNKLKC